MNEKPTIIVDTREQKPYKFSGSIRMKLDAGDYGVLGSDGKPMPIAVERKTAGELPGIVGKQRKRFVRELERLAELDSSAIVIESGLYNIVQPNPFSNVPPKAIINSLVSWMLRYKIPVLFCDSRRYAKAVTYYYLERYWIHKNLEEKARSDDESKPRG